MGTGIVQVAAENGYPVIIYNHNQYKSEKVVSRLQKKWQSDLEKGKITPEIMEKRLELIIPTNKLEDFKETDLVIEAIIEDINEKKKLFVVLDEICIDNTIFVSNTSSLPITEIASVTKRSDRVAGMHFFNPVPGMKLVEIIQGLNTSEETIETIKEVATRFNKVPVVTKDTPGFIVNRLVIQLCNEAVKAVEAGVASPEDIDTAMKLGMNWPMGPFELIDMAGLDLHINAADNLARELGDSHYACPRLVRQMVRANQLGRKNGKGFFKYQKS